VEKDQFAVDGEKPGTESQLRRIFATVILWSVREARRGEIMIGWIGALPSGEWGIVGTLFGAALTYAFAKRSQQQRWVVEGKKQEYRELLDALMRAEDELTKDWQWQDLGLEADQIFGRVFAEMHKVLRDRIFIGEIIEREQISEKWMVTLSKMQHELRVGDFRNDVDDIRKSITRAAREDLKI